MYMHAQTLITISHYLSIWGCELYEMCGYMWLTCQLKKGGNPYLMFLQLDAG